MKESSRSVPYRVQRDAVQNEEIINGNGRHWEHRVWSTFACGKQHVQKNFSHLGKARLEIRETRNDDRKSVQIFEYLGVTCQDQNPHQEQQR